MDTIQLTPETVDAYQKLLTAPQEHNLPFKPFMECFVESDTVTPKDVLAKQFLAYLKNPVPKVILYIIMDNLFGQCRYKAENGSLGYALKLSPECAAEIIDDTMNKPAM